MTDKSFLLELRETAKVTADLNVRTLLIAAADTLDTALTALHECASIGNMIVVNGAWVCAVNALCAAVMATPPNGNGGAGELPVEFLERKAA